MPLQKGDKARIAAPVVEGEVVDVKYDENTGEKRICLAWPDEELNVHHRWFKEDELVAVA